MEVDALFEAEASKKGRAGWKSQVHSVDNEADDIARLTRTVERLEKQVQKLSRQGERRGEDKKSSPDTAKRPETRKCFNCGIQGHLAANCKKPKKPKQSGNEEGQPDDQ